MTSHFTPVTERARSALPERPAAIVPMHVGTAPGEAKTDPADLALSQLKAFLDQESSGLMQVFSLLDLAGAGRDVEALQTLMKEPENAKHTLAAVVTLLDRIVEDLAEISPCAQPQRPLRTGEAATVRDLDGRVRWLGARAEDMRSRLSEGNIASRRCRRPGLPARRGGSPLLPQL